MKVSSHCFRLPKQGNSLLEYEDAAWPLDQTELDCPSFRCAVADGATESSFSDRWARLLVEGFHSQTDLADLRKSWQDEISTIELPWYAEQKADSGAYAALLGLVLEEGEGKISFTSTSVGDCCLFQIRKKHRIMTFPDFSFESFDSTPALLSSRADTSREEPEELTGSGEAKPGDNFVLLTDAIAAWTLRHPARVEDRLLKLVALKSQEEFQELVESQRDDRDAEGRPAMKNDDVTFLLIEITS
ncbi:MAG: protein phosphatase 2C domain-containing protein [Cyanobacteria bacterium HKST-UBA02]|nr:protein phosphatase 2C domain-containing protein [Cyanobacteria bacterium HKST-UBA02]